MILYNLMIFNRPEAQASNTYIQENKEAQILFLQRCAGVQGHHHHCKPKKLLPTKNFKAAKTAVVNPWELHRRGEGTIAGRSISNLNGRLNHLSTDLDFPKHTRVARIDSSSQPDKFNRS